VKSADCSDVRGDKIDESASPGDDVIQVIHSSPRIHCGGFLSGPIWVARIPLGGFVRHVELGNVIIHKFGRTGFPDAKSAGHSPQHERDVERCVRVQRVGDLDGVCAVVRVGDAHFWRVVDDYTIHAALHGAYQMVLHLPTKDCLMEDQDIHLASNGVVICNRTRYNGEFNRSESG
jgi:hypothetical protein